MMEPSSARALIDFLKPSFLQPIQLFLALGRDQQSKIDLFLQQSCLLMTQQDNYFGSKQMQNVEPAAFDSIRAEEKKYETEIRQTYKEHPDLFLTHSSDRLHLDLVEKECEGVAYKAVVTKSTYQKYDIISEIRGSVIGYDKLKGLLQGKNVEKSRLPLLLYLHAEMKYLIAPKNITKYLFAHPSYKLNVGQYAGAWSKRSNCYIENHFGFKLLVTASRDIQAGEQLILQQKSYDNLFYTAGLGWQS